MAILQIILGQHTHFKDLVCKTICDSATLRD